MKGPGRWINRCHSRRPRGRALELLLMLAGTSAMCTFTAPCRSQRLSDEAAGASGLRAEPAGSAQPGAPLGGMGGSLGPGVDFALRPAPTAAQGLHWQAPPLSWAGSVAYDHRIDRSAGATEQVQQLLTARIGASSWLVQPWLATLNGQLGLTAARSSAATPGMDSGERFVTGQGQLNLFPRSRFPFELRYEASDSRIDPNLAQTLSYTSRELALTQRYRPESGIWQVGAGYTRREQAGPEFGRDEQRIWSLDASATLGQHHLALNWADQRAQRELRAEQAVFHSVVARHSYAPSQEWQIETSGNWTRSEGPLLAGGSEVRMVQAGTLAFWRPQGQPFTFSASLRGLELHDELDGGHLLTQSASLGASWAITDALRLVASSSANRVESGSLQENSIANSVGANWQSQPLALGPFRYDWYAGMSANDLRASRVQEQAWSGQLGHTLSRHWSAGGQLWQWSLGQSLSAQHSRISGASGVNGASGGTGEVGTDPVNTSRTRLDTHSTALTWQSPGTRHAYARASISDARELGGGGARFQLLNLQASGQFELDRWRTLTGDLTWQQVRQSTDTSELTPALVAGTRYGSRMVGGELNYLHRRFWGQPGLRLGARLRVARDVLHATQTLALLPDRETRMAELRLDYQIGKLETGLLLRRAEFDGQWRDLLMWRIQRSLGGTP